MIGVMLGAALLAVGLTGCGGESLDDLKVGDCVKGNLGFEGQYERTDCPSEDRSIQESLADDIWRVDAIAPTERELGDDCPSASLVVYNDERAVCFTPVLG